MVGELVVLEGSLVGVSVKLVGVFVGLWVGNNVVAVGISLGILVGDVGANVFHFE